MLQCLSPLPSKIVWPQRISTNPRIYVNCGCIYSRISSYFTALKFLKWLQSQKWWHLPSQSFSQIQKSVESTGPDWEFFFPGWLVYQRNTSSQNLWYAVYPRGSSKGEVSLHKTNQFKYYGFQIKFWECHETQSWSWNPLKQPVEIYLSLSRLVSQQIFTYTCNMSWKVTEIFPDKNHTPLKNIDSHHRNPTVPQKGSMPYCPDLRKMHPEKDRRWSIGDVYLLPNYGCFHNFHV